MSPEEVAKLAYGFKPYFIKHLGRDKAEDFTQELFLAVYKALLEGSIRNSDDPTGWLITTSRYLVRCEIGKLTTRRTRQQDLTRIEQLRHSSLNHPSLAIYTDGLLRLVNYEDRELLDRYFYGGCTEAEISQLVGITQKAVSKRIHRALLRIKHAVEPTVVETKYKEKRKGSRVYKKSPELLSSEWSIAATVALYTKKSTA